MALTKFKHWMMAIRPKTLTAAVGPVMIATAMAFGDGIEHFPTALICLIAAISVQIGTNLANDYYDFKHGADTQERKGPTRVTQAGLIKPDSVKGAFVFAFAIFALACILLVIRGGWPFAILGIVSIISGIFYTAGPKPLGYIGLGDLFVLIFFGPVAVTGTYYVQTFEINSAVVLAGLPPGLIAVAILAVNNLRDMDSDRKSNKRTLAVRWGRQFTQYEYTIALFLAALIPIYIYYQIRDHIPILICPIIILMALPAIKNIFSAHDGPTLNKTLAYTGKILLVYSMLFSVGWIL